jgi:hypothetical protein
MKVHHPSKRFQVPDLFDWAAEQERRGADHRVRWVAQHCSVSLATAATLALNAGLFNREDH